MRFGAAFVWLWAHGTAAPMSPCENLMMGRREEPVSSKKQNTI